MIRIFLIFLLIATCHIRQSGAADNSTVFKREKVGNETVIWKKSPNGTGVLVYLESGRIALNQCIPSNKLKNPKTVKTRIRDYKQSKEVKVQRDSLIKLFGHSLELTVKIKLLESRGDSPVTLNIGINSRGKIVQVVFVLKQEEMGIFTSKDICEITKALSAQFTFTEPSRFDLGSVSLDVPIFKRNLSTRRNSGFR